jgi:hypothetical protein|tara:strand:+ start:72 stop:380 length:309 start_codon:yes stop_codon:yes gene_type:complete
MPPFFSNIFVQTRQYLDITVCVDVFQPFYGGRTSGLWQGQPLYGYERCLLFDSISSCFNGIWVFDLGKLDQSSVFISYKCLLPKNTTEILAMGFHGYIIEWT